MSFLGTGDLSPAVVAHAAAYSSVIQPAYVLAKWPDYEGFRL